MRMYDFKYKLLDMINQSGLTIEEVYYVWKDIYEELTTTYNNLLVKEQQEKNKEEEKQENKIDEEIQE